MPAAESEPARSPLVERLQEARVTLRADLEVTRHIFREEVHYVLQDPLTFQSHSFDVNDYAILARLTIEKTLTECFDSLVERGRLEAEDEERFFQFIFSLHRIGFLKLPVSDGETLYRRHRARSDAKKKGRFSSILFMPVPLLNPDQLLTRTIRYFRPLCTKRAFYVWLTLVALAILVLIRNWGEFQRPVTDIFSGENLPLLWLTLIGLKVAHEFGHAYACKYFGGHVPEMGVMLILFTPCAFVDASASWTFSKKSQRLIVCMAGMYVELTIAAIAMLVWSVTSPGVLRECLHNVVLLASIVTIGFNINPLMRYDGYYALTDVVEVPNLRARSSAYALAVLKKWVLGIPIADRPKGSGLRAGLLCFGAASAVYKITLVLGISIAIAFKFLIGGLALGVFYFGGEIVKIVKRTIPYLWNAEELQSRRVWARFLGVSLAGVLPLAVVAMPIPNRVTPPGVVVGGSESMVRAQVSGFLGQVHVEPGTNVDSEQELMRLLEPDKAANLAMTRAQLDGAQLRERVFRATDIVLAAEENQRIEQLEDRLNYLQLDLERLRISAEEGGLVISSVRREEIGRFIRRGEEVATIIRGHPVIRALLTEDDVAATAPRVGTRVEFRSHDDATRVYSGVIRRIDPTGTRTLDSDFMEHLDLTEFALHPLTQKSSRSQFEIEVALSEEAWFSLRHGMTGRLQIVGEPETIGRILYRKFTTLMNKLEG